MTKKTTTTNILQSKAYRDALLAGAAPTSQRAYERDLRYFWAWAKAAHKISERYPVPLDFVVQFILEHSGQMNPKVEARLVAEGLRKRPGALRIRTLRRYLASLSVAHAEHGVTSPTLDPQLKLLLRRLQRAQATLPSHKKAALTADLLKKLVATCDNSLRGIRDRAILLVGFASGGRRRAELVNLQVEDLQKVEGGYIIGLRKSKTDQEGNGVEIPILHTAASALKKWLMRSGIRSGRLFRGICPDGSLNDTIDGKTINRIVKNRAELAGLDPKPFGAHSLRSGFITETGRRGAALGDAMRLSGHRTVDVAQNYYRAGEVLRNPTAHLLKDSGKKK